MTKKNKIIIIVIAVVLVIASAATATVLLVKNNKKNLNPTAKIVTEISSDDENPTIEISFTDVKLNKKIGDGKLIFSKAFRNLTVENVEKKDDKTFIIKTKGTISDEFAVGAISIPGDYFKNNEGLEAESEIILNAPDPFPHLGLNPDDIPAIAARALIKAGINKKIPFIGSTVSIYLDPIISDVLGISKTATITDVLAELETIKKDLAEIKATLDQSTQEIKDEMLKDEAFTYFDNQVTSLMMITDDLYKDIYRIESMTKFHEEEKEEEVDKEALNYYKMFKVAEILDFNSRNISDYVNTVRATLTYLDGSNVSMPLKNGGGVYDNAFLFSCKDSVLGGEASMVVGPYLNVVSNQLSNALKAMILVLESKISVATHYTTIYNYAKDHNAEDLLRLLDASAEKKYRDPDNLASWKQMISDKDSSSFIKLYNYYFGDEESVSNNYNEMVQKHWFSFIRDYRVENSKINVTFAELNKDIVAVKPTELGLKWNARNAATESVVINVNGALKEKVNVALTKAEIEKLVSQVVKNPNNTYLSAESTEGMITVDDYLLDMLGAYGFNVEKFNDTKSLFISSSDGKYSQMPVYDAAGSHRLGYDYSATLTVSAYNCNDIHGYNTDTGVSFNDAVWNNVKYFNYYYKLMSGKTELPKEEDYVFYYFAPAEVNISTKKDLVDFLQKVAGGDTFEKKTVNFLADIDMTGESFAYIWENGNYNKEFRGTINGNSHVIKNIKEITANPNGGLFAVLGEGANIKELNLEGFNINGTGSNSGFGALAGSINGYVRINNVNVVGGSISGANCVGGLIGEIKSGSTVISACTSDATVTATGNYAGGIIGASNNKQRQNITFCTNTGTVTASSGKAAGGIIAYMANDSQDQPHVLEKNQNDGVIICNGYAGGIIGHLDTDSTQHKVINNKNYGKVTSNSSYAGGIVAFSEGGGNFTGNFNSGEIRGSVTAGILGYNEDDAIDFTESVNSGLVCGTKQSGGILGYTGTRSNDKKYIFDKCENNAEVISQGSYAGGIVGELSTDNLEHSFVGCKNTAPVTGDISTGGICGKNEGGANFTDCVNTGAIISKRTCAAGICAYCVDDSSKFTNCVNEADISGVQSSGGIVGELGDKDHDKVFTFVKCENKGKVTATELNAGGIIGMLKSDSTKHNIESCINTGAVKGNTTSGGIIGFMYGGGNVKLCENSADITGNDYVGGIIGRIEDDTVTFTDCKNIGKLSATGSHKGETCGYDGKRKSTY